MRIGTHVSAAGGFTNAVLNAQRIGAETIQLFGASPRRWEFRRPAAPAALAFRAACRAADLDPVFLHGPYLINLASPSVALRQKSETVLAGHLQIAEDLGAAGVIFHVGSGAEVDKEPALREIIQAMRRILLAVPGRAQLIVENSAGGRGKVAAAPAEIGRILDAVGERSGGCFDTAHALEAGIIATFGREEVSALTRDIGRTIGWSRLRAIHANDSKTPFDSRHDRHENLGRGHIGLAGFRVLAAEPHFRQIPWILEVPGFDGAGPDKKNMDILRRLTRGK